MMMMVINDYGPYILYMSYVERYKYKWLIASESSYIETVAMRNVKVRESILVVPVKYISRLRLSYTPSLARGLSE